VVRLLRRFIPAIACVLACAGCRLDANVLVDVGRDGSGIVTVTAVADKDMLGRGGLALADLRLDDVKQAGWTVEAPTATSSGGRQMIISKAFHTTTQADQILSELSGPAGPLHGLKVTQKREFARIVTNVQGEVGLDGGVAGLGDDELVQLLGGQQVLQGLTGANLAEHFVVTVTLKGPGAPVGPATASGPMDGATRTPLALKAVESDQPASRARKVSYLAMLGAVLTAALSLVLLRRRRLASQRRQVVWRR
jgi:hypothetical protein